MKLLSVSRGKKKKGGWASGQGAKEVVVESPSPEVFRRRVDGALRDMRG